MTQSAYRSMRERHGAVFGSSGGGGGGSQSITTSQQIPQFEQDYAQQNQQLAASMAAQPFPLYQGPLVSSFTPTQEAGQAAAINAANTYQPNLDAATALTSAAVGSDPLAYGQPTLNAGTNAIGTGFANGNQAINAGVGAIGNGFANGNQAIGAGMGAIGGALGAGPNNPGVVQSYMSPFVHAALQPQITALNEQLGQQQKQIASQATGANAFGDARQGAQSALANFYGDQSLAGLLGSGYNTAYTNALQTAMGEQGLGLQGGQSLVNAGLGQIGAGNQAGQTLGTLGLGQISAGNQAGQILGNLGLGQMGAGIQEQNVGLAGGAQLGNLGQLQQQLGLTGANAIYGVGQQQQQQQQQVLNTAYQQYQNQVQWPFQMENVRLSALSNSPYNITNQVTLPAANQTASNLGAFAGLAGLLGGGASSQSALSPYGGSAYNSATAHA